MKKFINPKYHKRLSLIIGNSANTLLLPVLNISVSLLVIRFSSVELWGNFVQTIIIVNLANHVMIWGNKEYLLREFSRRPAALAESWQSCLSTRFVFYILFAMLAMVFPWALDKKVLVLLWVLTAYFYQSFDVVVLYRRRFVFSFILEASVLSIFLLALIYLKYQLTVELLIGLFASTNLLKLFLTAIYFRKDLFPRFRAKFDFQILVYAFPFFLLGLSGMLQSKVDLYCVAIFLPEDDVGRYQVFINLFIYLQTLAGVILMPFVKNIYRMRAESIRKISTRLLVTGILITIPAVPAIYLVLTRIYHLQITFPFLLWGALFVIPIFYYLPRIYALYKINLPMKVLLINLYGTILNFILNLILIFKFGLIGAIVASALSQWFMLTLYLVYERKYLQGHQITLSQLPSSD